MSRVLDVTRSGDDAWKPRGERARDGGNRRLEAAIQRRYDFDKGR